jgi:hypothetical protein
MRKVQAFLTRPIEGDWPSLWIDATYVKARQNGRVVSMAVIVAVGGNADGRREVLGLDVGPSEAETFWTSFLRKLDMVAEWMQSRENMEQYIGGFIEARNSEGAEAAKRRARAETELVRAKQALGRVLDQYEAA